MKRTVPQKVKPVAHLVADDATAEQCKQVASGVVNRRVRTSAAMVGLALSMGAANLLLPHQDDAIAAEPQAAESTTAAPLDAQAATPSANAAAAESVSARALPLPSGRAAVIHHVVRPGQTLWQLAQRYGADVEALAVANGLTTHSILRAGQVIKISAAPGASITASVATISSPAADMTVQLPQAEAVLSSDSQLKAEQDTAIDRLQQSREKLRDSLAELRLSAPQRQVFDAKVSGEASTQQRSKTPELAAQAEAVPVVGSEATVPPTAPSAVASLPETASTYQVKPGDTLGAIAHAHDVAPDDLVALNHLENPDWLRTNQSLMLPPVASGTTAAAPQIFVAPQPAPARAPSVSYRVSSGDTIATIADQYNVSQAVLVDTNELDNPNRIAVNQVLNIPMVTATASVVNSPSLPATATEPVAGTVAATGSAPYYSMVTVPTVPAASVPAASAGVASVGAASVPAASSEIAAVPPAEASGAVASIPDANESVGSTGAVLPPQTEPTTIAANPSQGSNPYVENLMVEILSLRDQYRNDDAVTAASPSAVPTSAPHSSLEATSTVARAASSPDLLTEAFQAEVRRLRQEQQAQQTRPVPRATAPVRPSAVSSTASPTPQTATTPSVSTPSQVVAVAPLGSESYAPLVQPVTGQIVSPDLPPLPGADAYLPQGAEAFNGYQWPARGVLTSGYGWRWGRMHRGIDIGAPIGTPVMAAASGVVEFAGWNSGGYGNLVDIRHPDGSRTRYAHNSRLLVRAGQEVQQGQQISEVGSTGYSTGPHLHFEVHPRNQGAVNPIAFLPQTR